jgi:chromate transport protein ChrA
VPFRTERLQQAHPRVTFRSFLARCLLTTLLMVVSPGKMRSPSWPAAWAQVLVIVVGALVGWVIYRRAVEPLPEEEHTPIRGHRTALAALMVFGLILVGLPMVVKATGSRDLAVFDGFYRSGSLVFGGGHVVLPLLRAEVVPNSWVNDDMFLTGYGAAQAIPGPLFTFAGYLGAVIYASPRTWTGIVGGAWCLLAIFLPAWLLIGGAIPFWHDLRAKTWAQAGLLSWACCSLRYTRLSSRKVSADRKTRRLRLSRSGCFSTCDCRR